MLQVCCIGCAAESRSWFVVTFIAATRDLSITTAEDAASGKAAGSVVLGEAPLAALFCLEMSFRLRPIFCRCNLHLRRPYTSAGVTA